MSEYRIVEIKKNKRGSFKVQKKSRFLGWFGKNRYFNDIVAAKTYVEKKNNVVAKFQDGQWL